MIEKIAEIYQEVVIAEHNKSLRHIYCFACSINFFVNESENKPKVANCKGARDNNFCKSWRQTTKMKAHLLKWDSSNLISYTNNLLKNRIEGHKLSEISKDLLIKQFKSKLNFEYDGRKANPLFKKEQSLKDFKINYDINGITSVDIPHLTTKEISNSKKFASLYNLFYHLEVSLRNYLRKRLRTIYKDQWEIEVENLSGLSRAVGRKKESLITEYYPKRGNDILNYCNWIDYGSILQIDKIWDRKTDLDEFRAHISAMYKIRNSIAHNAELIPIEIINEMEVFVQKYVSIMK